MPPSKTNKNKINRLKMQILTKKLKEYKSANN